MSVFEPQVGAQFPTRMPEDKDEALRIMWAMLMDMRAREEKRQRDEQYRIDSRIPPKQEP